MKPEASNQKSPRPGHRLALVGAWMQLGPVIGTTGTVVGMVRAFNQIHQLEPGSVASPADISSSIGLAMYTTAIGMIFAIIGAVLVLFAALKRGYRAPWLFWFLIIIGVPFLVTALSKRAEFLRPSLPPGESAPPFPRP